MTERFVCNDDGLLDIAEQRMSDGNITGAVSVYRNLLSKTPFGYDQNAGIAEAFTEAGLFSSAINAWYRALSVAADSYQKARAYNGLGANYYFLNNRIISYHYFGLQLSEDAFSDYEYNDVLDDIQEAEAEESNNPHLYVAYDKNKKPTGLELIEKARTLSGSGDIEGAFETLSSIDENDKHYEEGIGIAAFLLLMSGKENETIEFGEYLIKRDKDDFFGNYILAGCYKHTDEKEKSAHCFDICASTDPNTIEKYDLRMLLLCIDTGREKEGIFYASEILKEAPFDLDTLFTRATLEFNSGDRDGSLADYKKVITFTDNPAAISRYNFIKQLDGDTDEKLSYEMNIKDAAMSYMLDYIKKGIAVPENVSFGEVKTHLEYVIRYGISEFVSNVLQLALVVDAHATQEFLRKIFLDVTVSDEIKSEIIRVYLVLGISIPVKCVSANLYKEFTIRSVRFAGYASSLFNLAYALAASTVYMIDNTKVSLLKSKAFKAQANYEERGGDEDKKLYAPLAAAIIYSMRLKVISDKELLTTMFELKKEDLDKALAFIAPVRNKKQKEKKDVGEQ